MEVFVKNLKIEKVRSTNSGEEYLKVTLCLLVI